MEQEIIKHIEKLRRKVRNKNSSVWEKIKEIVIEICVIIFAVTLSMWLHNWSEHREQQHEVKEFLRDLKSDLNIDIRNMSDARNTLENNLKTVKLVEDSLSKSRSSTTDGAFDLINRETHRGDYESFKSSGKIGNIENKEIKKMIITYYEEEMPVVYKIENLYNDNLLKTYELSSNAGKDIIEKRLNLSKNAATGLIRNYDEDIQTAKDIIKAIDNQYK